MPRQFSMTNSGMLLQPIMDPLARSDVSIGQSPCDFVRATSKLSVKRPFGERKGVGSLHAYCVNLMQLLGRSSSPISGEHLPPSGELLARWSSQGEKHTHALRKRASAGGVRRTQRYTWIARAGLEHRALGPCRLAEFFLSSYGRCSGMCGFVFVALFGAAR